MFMTVPNPRLESHKYWMGIALTEAEKALELDEVPIGCVIVRDNLIIARSHNLTERLHNATAHAELLALSAAHASLESRFLVDCTLYVTIEPCPMCAGAIVLARIPTVVFGAYDLKAGACGTLYTITEDSRLNHQVHTIGGVLDEQCASLISGYFRNKRSTWEMKDRGLI
jgi:tRNA(adenine34) deaminase